MNHPQDHFSHIATAYKDGRITYPKEHLSSWSGTRYHREASKVDLMPETGEELNALWGDEILTVQWSSDF